MKKAYPVILTPADEGGFTVYIPDFHIGTQGDDEVDAIDMARDAICMTGCFWEDEGKQLPTPSDLNSLSLQEGEFKTLVDVDFTMYRKRNDNKAVRKNCTIPSWLNDAAEQAGINFSVVLQEALKAQLGI